MHADPKKLKSATYGELCKELAMVDEELHDSMQPISYARYLQLHDYRKEVWEEIERRRLAKNA